MSYPPPAEPINGNGLPPSGHYAYPPSNNTPLPHTAAPPNNDPTSIRVSTGPVPGTIETQIQLDIGYFKSLPGIIKLIELGLGILCMILSAPARSYRFFNGSQFYFYGEGQNHWFLFVVVISFTITILWCFFYLLQLKSVIKNSFPFSWLKLEYFYTLITTILYITAFIVILEGFGYCPGYSVCDMRISAGSFAIFNTIAYGIGTFLLHQEYVAQNM
eukprot:TRINITY_DN5313_c0_g1_i1.p1 TRINITY_DN5313_c0_g1~~TRINITY_DN5313_c0_g1_i1.p1  ORF type:complete len:217 (+),score=1.91 TRINITY_DN5313_c0_g1_i1:127-777(+)